MKQATRNQDQADWPELLYEHGYAHEEMEDLVDKSEEQGREVSAAHHTVPNSTREILAKQEEVAQNPPQVQQELRRATRERKVLAKYKDYVLDFSENETADALASDVNMAIMHVDQNKYYDNDYVLSLHNVMQVKEPSSYHEASKDPQWT